MPPGLAKLWMNGRVGNKRWHHAISSGVEFVRRLSREYGGKVTLQIARVDVFGFAIEAVDHQHYFEQESFFIVPMVVDGGFADSGGLGDSIHAGGLNAALGKECECGVEDLFVCFE